MPIVTAPHFLLDLQTLFAATVFLSATGGLLLIFAWIQNRRAPALAFWGCGYLLGTAAATLLGGASILPAAWSAGVANALLCGAYGLMWGGARSFEGRSFHPFLIAAGAMVWLAAFQFDTFAQSMVARIDVVSVITAFYALMSVRELWYARDRELLSRWPTIVLVTCHAGFILMRIPFADTLALSAATGRSQGMIVTVIAFQAMFTTFCLPFLRVAMTKERAELEQRNAALTDLLTGVANRRAFFERGTALLEGALADRSSTALLLFDLDRFKEVNDTSGHQAGDRVLQVFCELVAGSIRPGDLFGRLGGEEFACLLTDASMAHAVRTAEFMRRAFAATELPGLTVSPTVSIGVAMAGESGRSLSALLASADRALYRAKTEGRNRVAPVPLVLVEPAAETTRRDRTVAFAVPGISS